MTGILLAERVFTRHPIPAGIYDTFRMPRGSSYVLNSSIDMILSKNNRYFYNIAGCRHKINVRNPRKKFSFLVYINKNIRNVLLFSAPESLKLIAITQMEEIRMPVNSFDHYPMSWKPDKEKLTSPIYYCLADMMERDIKNGVLTANTKLPPQRELADFLDLNLSTITKAYKLCEMRGLVHAITGRGTFVAPSANVAISTAEKTTAPRIELAIIHPFYESNKLIRDLTIEILKQPFSEQLFEYSHPLGNRGQIQVASRWLQRFGVGADETNTLITAGAQNALAAILSSLFEAGDKIAVDPYTYPNFISLANLLYLHLIPIETDEHGMRPDALESACATQNIKGLYLMPTGTNPTNIAFTSRRRKEIAQLIRKKNLIAIEDDNYAALMEEKCPPITLEAPENCLFISGISKPLCPGLRIAYLYVPPHFMADMERGIFSHNLKISSLNIEIATELIRSGLDQQIIQKKREAAIQRNQIYYSYFPASHPYLESYYQWLELPAICSGRLCEAELAHQGIGVFGAERFSVGTQARNNAIRVATCSPKNEQELRTGLEKIQQFIREQTSDTAGFIV